MKFSPEPDLKNSTTISSRRPSAPSKPHSTMPTSKRTKSTKSSSSEVQQEFPKSDNQLRTSSTEKNPTLVSTLMRLLPTVLPSREVSFVVKKAKKLKDWSLLMPLLFLLVLKLLEVSCPSLFQRALSSQPKKAKSSQLTKITNKLSQFKSLKVKDL